MKRDYVPYYCEENVLRLLSGAEFADREAYALFIFGCSGRAAMFAQKAGSPEAGGLVVWDYHVVVLDLGPRIDRPAAARVLDFDTVLGFSIPADEYFDASFEPAYRNDFPLAELVPVFRLVAAGDYIECFESDRSHMLGPDGRYLAPPPRRPPPRSSDPSRALRLGTLIDPSSRFPQLPGSGAPMDLDGLRAFIGASPAALTFPGRF